MAITAKMVSELRSRTGAGIMDCKKVLAETDGDIDAAIQKLREKGLKASELKSGRATEEGLIVQYHGIFFFSVNTHLLKISHNFCVCAVSFVRSFYFTEE